MSVTLSISQLAATSFIAILGWFALHRLSAKRDVENKRRELQVQALQRIFLKLANASHRKFTDEICADFESAIAEINIYVNQKMVALVERIVEEFKKGNPVGLDEILFELRHQIRENLNLEKINYPVWYIRFQRKMYATP